MVVFGGEVSHNATYHRMLDLEAKNERLRAAIRDHQSSLEVWTQDIKGRWQLVREADGLLWSALDEPPTTT